MIFNQWKKIIEQERKEKDRFFIADWQSPISSEDRHKFNGLIYYPPNPNYRFELELQEHKNKKMLQIQDTTGNVRNFIRWGEFRFKLSDKEFTIQAYKSDIQEKQLFVPFKDATNNRETYGAGRYLDLDYERDRTVDGKWVLDFNKAYNPWCAYSINYSCPFVAPENWLKIPILAGEKYSLKKYGKENKVTIIIAFPFPNIPIGDYFVNSVREAIEKLGAKPEIKITVMDQKEQKRFLTMEQENWKENM